VQDTQVTDYRNLDHNIWGLVSEYLPIVDLIHLLNTNKALRATLLKNPIVKSQLRTFLEKMIRDEMIAYEASLQNKFGWIVNHLLPHLYNQLMQLIEQVNEKKLTIEEVSEVLAAVMQNNNKIQPDNTLLKDITGSYDKLMQKANQDASYALGLIDMKPAILTSLIFYTDLLLKTKFSDDGPKLMLIISQLEAINSRKNVCTTKKSINTRRRWLMAATVPSLILGLSGPIWLLFLLIGSMAVVGIAMTAGLTALGIVTLAVFLAIRHHTKKYSTFDHRFFSATSENKMTCGASRQIPEVAIESIQVNQVKKV